MKKLEIRNYKCFKHLEITDLKRVNLFTGKNNVGKSSILEAVSLFAERGSIYILKKLLINRGELIFNDSIIDFYFKDIIETHTKVFSSFFNNRKVSYNEDDFIIINNEEEKIELRFVKLFEEEIFDLDSYGNKRILGKKYILSKDHTNDSTYLGFEIKSSNFSKIYNFNDKIFKGISANKNSIISHYINPKGDDTKYSAILWDLITLTEKEELLIDALKIIEPDIERLSFIGKDNNTNSRYPIIKLKSQKETIPLKSMGDGINRLLNILLAMVNCDNGFLLIDEFENGLHYSVQEQLWEVIFETAEKLDIQVFATTHSNDTINAFAKMMKKNESYEGSLYRLDKKQDEITAYNFSKEEIMIAANQQINLR